MFLQFCSAQVRSEINIRRLKRFSRDRAQRCRDIMVKEARHRLVISDVTARTLSVSQPNRASANQIAVIAAQCGDMKWVDQVAERRVAFFPKTWRCISKSFVQLRIMRGTVIALENARRQQYAQILLWHRCEHSFIRPQTRNHRCQFRPQPEWKQISSHSTSYPRHSSLQSKCRKQVRPWRQLFRYFSIRTKDTVRIQIQRLLPNFLQPQPPLRFTWHQMQRQFIQQAIKTIRRKCRGIGLPRHSFLLSHQACHPLKPRRIV